MPTLIELEGQLEAGRKELKAKFDSYKEKTLADGSKAKDIPAADIAEIKSRNEALNELGVQVDALKSAALHQEALAKGEAPANRKVGEGVAQKSLADALLESEAFAAKSLGKFQDVAIDVDMKSLLGLEQKTTMTTAAGFAPFVSRDGNVVPAISRPPQLLDFLRIEPTNQNAVKFMKQTTRTNAAAAKAEGVALAEAAIAYAEATVDIRKIGVYIPITEEQLEDDAAVRALVENDLRLMVRQKLDDLVTVGDGVAPNILGAYSAVAAQTQARGSDEEFDQLMKAMTLCRVTGRSRPNLVVLHSNNYQRLAMTRTADGIYIYGSPSDAPMQRVWGVNIALSEALTAGTGMVIDTDFLRLKLRKDVTIAASDSHGEYFIQNMLALRAHIRAGLQIQRDESVVKLTGMRS